MKSPYTNKALEDLQVALLRSVTRFVATEHQAEDNTQVIQGLNLVVSIEHLMEKEGSDCARYVPEGCPLAEGKACDAGSIICGG